ncbi:MAG: molybdenum ABC transporter ATP-binding protein [Sulfuricaulis sp.]
MARDGIHARFELTRAAFALRAEFNAPERGITAVFGPSGGGKTTLLRCIAGLERAAGRFSLADEVWQDDAAGTFVVPHRRAVGVVFQEANLFPHLTVRGNIEYGWRRVPRDARRVPLDRTIELLGLEALLARYPERLSGGERQRVAIARALVTSPRLLIMDEPLAALDREAKAGLMPYLESLHATLEIPVLYVSHALEEVTRLADHLLVLCAGKVQAFGPLADMLVNLESSITGTEEAGAVIDAVVAGHEDGYDLSVLEFAGGRLMVARRLYPLGRRARLHIHARDVSIALSRAIDTSILNILPARVAQIAEAGPGQWLLRLEIGDAHASSILLSRITRRSGEALGLRPGMPVYAQIKSVALLD